MIRAIARQNEIKRDIITKFFFKPKSSQMILKREKHNLIFLLFVGFYFGDDFDLFDDLHHDADFCNENDNHDYF